MGFVTGRPHWPKLLESGGGSQGQKSSTVTVTGYCNFPLIALTALACSKMRTAKVWTLDCLNFLHVDVSFMSFQFGNFLFLNFHRLHIICAFEEENNFDSYLEIQSIDLALNSFLLSFGLNCLNQICFTPYGKRCDFSCNGKKFTERVLDNSYKYGTEIVFKALQISVLKWSTWNSVTNGKILKNSVIYELLKNQ